MPIYDRDQRTYSHSNPKRSKIFSTATNIDSDVKTVKGEYV
jgi:hypothetical protein